MMIFGILKLILANAGCTPSNPNGFIHFNGPTTCANNDTIQTAFFITYSIIGSMALLFMVIAGIRYVLSKGEPDGVQRAKNEMKYTLIGMVLVTAAAMIVNFALNHI